MSTNLADATYRKAAGVGLDAVYEVANANSTPGFLRKLLFALVSPLDAKIGLGNIARLDWGASPIDCAFQRFWNLICPPLAIPAVLGEPGVKGYVGLVDLAAVVGGELGG